MNLETLRAFYERPPAEAAADSQWPEAHDALLPALESGQIRSAEPDGAGDWRVNTWVKQAILAGFRATKMVELPGPGYEPRAYDPRAGYFGPSWRD